MKAFQKLVALLLITGVPALALFVVGCAVGLPLDFAAIIALGLFGLGLDVCLRGR